MRRPDLDGVTVTQIVAASAATVAAVLADTPSPALVAALAAALVLLALLLPKPVPAVVPVSVAPREEESVAPGDSEKLRHEIRQMTTMLDRELVQAMGDVVARTNRMAECAGDLRAMAADIRQSSAVTADAVQVASTGVMTTAEAAGELSHSLEKVRADVRRTGEMCHQAVERASVADRTVQSLADATTHIGQVVGVIGAIARQTNMLALNATIEAARAGEMGKGFAVVATEVKTLATSTARSTEDISRQVEDIRSAIDGAVGSIGAIVEVIHQLDHIATAMEGTMSGHLALIEGIASRTGEAAKSIRVAETHLQTALTVNDRVTGAVQEVDSEVEEVATRIKGFQKMTALVVKRGLRVAGEEARQSPYRGIDFIIGNRRLPVEQVKVEAGSARFRTTEAVAGGAAVEVEIPVIGRIPAVVERVQDGLVELAFCIDDGVRARLGEWLCAREAAE